LVLRFFDFSAAMKRTTLFCLLSALVGALAATALHQTSPRWSAQAQEPPRRPPLIRSVEAPPPTAAAPRRITPLPSEALAGSAFGSGLDDFAPEERTNILVYEKSNKSVVHITTKSAQRELLILEVPSEGAGSGSVLDKSGHILTNYHVVEGAQEIRVTLHNGESYEGNVIGYDPPNDMAVIKINASADELVPMELGDSSRLRVGQIVYAIGNPYGLERTMTTGIISSLNRSLPGKGGRTMRSMVQIDAALNRGNSGGPLLDTRGRLIGMNTAIASSTGENTGVGFAIPVDAVKRVVPQLIATGRVIRPDAGINRVYQSEQGLTIATLTPGGPAERAGLRGFRIVREQRRGALTTYETRRVDRSQADTVVAVDGEKATTADAFLSLIERHRPGEQAIITVIRSGQLVDVSIMLGSGE
jgi:S1-C subfamily serine protease